MSILRSDVCRFCKKDRRHNASEYLKKDTRRLEKVSEGVSDPYFPSGAGGSVKKTDVRKDTRHPGMQATCVLFNADV